jgi:hypothetical protein
MRSSSLLLDDEVFESPLTAGIKFSLRRETYHES